MYMYLTCRDTSIKFVCVRKFIGFASCVDFVLKLLGTHIEFILLFLVHLSVCAQVSDKK